MTRRSGTTFTSARALAAVFTLAALCGCTGGEEPDVRTDAAADVPADLAVDMPAPMSSDAPRDVAADVPLDVPMDASADIPAMFCQT